MIPRTYPSTLNPATGQRQLVALFLSDVTGLQRWSDYIPVNFGKGTTLIEGSYDNNGYIAVQEITSGLGLIPFGDYVPIFFDPAATDTWQVSNLGFIPYGASGVTSAPSLDLVFTRSDSLDTRITFTRTTAATRTNAAGLIEAVAIDAPRFDYDPVTLAPKGLLIEEQRTNLLTYSEQFNNVVWGKTRSSITANAIISPDGALDADKLVIDTTASTTHNIGENFSVISGTAYTWVVYAKAGEISQINMRFSAQFPSGNTTFDCSTVTVTNGGSITASSITPVGNGWYRCAFTQTASTSGTASSQIFLAQNGVIMIPTGDGTSGIYIWGAQLEAGAFATSYIPTVASQVTRAADVAVMTGTNFSSWYNQSEGTFVAQWTLGADLSATTIYQADAGPSSYIRTRYGNAGTANDSAVFVLSVGQAALASSVQQTPFTTYKNAMAYKVNDFARSPSGTAVITDTSGTIPTVDTFRIGCSAVGGEQPNGHIQSITYYPIRFLNTILVSLSS